MTDLRSPEEVWDDAIAAWAADTVDTRQAAAAIIRARDEEVAQQVTERVERDTIRRVVEWLREKRSASIVIEDTYRDIATDLEADEWKGTDHG